MMHTKRPSSGLIPRVSSPFLRPIKCGLVALVGLGLLLGTGACRDRTNVEEAEDTEVSEPDRNLTFNNITLEQSNDDGQILWRMTADRAVYSQDRQTAQIQKPSGEFLDDNEAALRVQAEEGEVRNDGEEVILRGDVVATDVETGAILRGDELEWRTGEDLVILRGNVIGTHPDFAIAADEARASISESWVEVTGNIAAVSEDDTLQLEAETLLWQLDEELLISEEPIRIQQREDNQVTARARGDRAEFNLAENIAILEENALVVSQEPPLRITGEFLQWNITENTVAARERFTAVHRQERITLSADQGNGNLDTEVFRMNGNVVVTSQQNQARLTSNQLTWRIPSQELIAEGDVVYRQTDPVLDLQGERARGRLADQTIVVTGEQVVTEIIPEPTN